jgi:hypothetical protein
MEHMAKMAMPEHLNFANDFVTRLFENFNLVEQNDSVNCVIKSVLDKRCLDISNIKENLAALEEADKVFRENMMVKFDF